MMKCKSCLRNYSDVNNPCTLRMVKKVFSKFGVQDLERLIQNG
jgi:hypothetical protein